MFTANSYVGRYCEFMIKNKCKQTLDEYKYFPSKYIGSPDLSLILPVCLLRDYPKITSCKKEVSLDEFMVNSKTTAFIVIQNDSILYENYFNGYQRDSVSRMYSITKSFLSAIIGIAIKKKYIQSVDDELIKYIPELNSSLSEIKISNLLKMDSGIGFKEGIYPWSNEAQIYFTPNCRKLALNAKIRDEIAAFFHYNNYHPLLLSIILERVIPNSLANFFEEELWKPIGAEFSALLTTDTLNGLEKMESGLNARAIDIAKLGLLFLHKGNLNGKQIIDEQWIEQSTAIQGAHFSKQDFRYYEKHPWSKWFSTGHAYYKYLWWGYKVDSINCDYFAMGILGQFIYVSPRKDTVIVRLGHEWGIKDWWPTIIKNFIDNL
ncbi:MAG: hypothetical protein H6Q74_3087 [Firmicutes bacterium]|nr:hypothetical protein [Bacillota bacterium]